MKNINYLFIAIASLVFGSCNDKYPDLTDGIYAEFVTNKGTAVAELKFKETPLTVANFVSLAEGENTKVDSAYVGKRFYDGLTFHRIIKDFMIQGGDPLGTGAGDPGYKFEDEIRDSLQHDTKGTLSMANSGPGTNGSQFFITLKETPWLNGRHTVFGKIVVGQSVIDSLGVVETSKPGDKPLDTIVLQKLNIIRKGSDAKAFDAPVIFTKELDRLEAEKLEKEAKIKELSAATVAKLEAQRTKATTLKSGLQFLLTEKGTGEKLKAEDAVGVFYVGYLATGEIFDTNIKDLAQSSGQYNQRRDDQKGYEPMPVPYSDSAQMIPGFKEGILNMKQVGDKATFFIPSHLAYGEQGGGPIPPNAELIFEVEFAKVVEKTATGK